ncbi:MAG: GNAT family N-acetyltransferase [Trebonia sp.]|jgi:GNAT superfamily N-acetyltransferase
MRITRLDHADHDGVRACYDVWLAAHAVDDPLSPSLSLPVFRHWLARGWESEPSETWVAVDEATGETVGWYRIELPDLENRHRASGSPTVRPASRRRGAGTALLRHEVERARANGRTVLRGGALVGSAGDAFARQAGAEASMVDARRVQDLRKIPPGLVASLRETAAGAAAGYSLESWTGPTPEEHLDRVAAGFNAMNDAPHSPDREDDIWDAQRVRERADAAVREGCLRGYSIAAIADATGEMAGLTQVFVDPEYPEWGHQGVTAVTRPHRGHRLGLLIKAAMLEWLATEEPKLEQIATDNAATNKYMIAVNETLGYELMKPDEQSFQLAVSPG